MKQEEAGTQGKHKSNDTNENSIDTNTMVDNNNTSEHANQEGEEAAVMIHTATAAVATVPTENPQTASELLIVPSVCVEVDQGTTSSPPTKNKTGRKLVGKKVETAFGVGVVVNFRTKDAVYEIQLENSTSSDAAQKGTKNVTTLYSVQEPKICKPSQAEIANQLNVAYEALETMRRLNLDVQCYEAGISSAEVDYDMCTACLLANKGSTKSHFPRLQNFVDTAHVAGKDLDQQVKEQLPGLHKFFNPMTKKQMAARISASFQEASALTSSISTSLAAAMEGPSSLPKTSETQQSPVLVPIENSATPKRTSQTQNNSKTAAAAATPNRMSMGFRSFMASPVTKTIFGETKVKEEGSSADPNVILNNRITSSQGESVVCKKIPPKSDKPIALPRIQRLINKRTQANTSPCLICASPSCASCSSTSFRKEGITLCLKCERLFELDFIVDCVSTSDAAQRAERIEYMVDCYDRCMLLLQYSKQFGEQIAASLEDQKNKQDKIGLASSSVGVLSGVLGIAAAASILTPAGPPLLIASLFFGGSATTVQSGTEALNYLSEPRKLADRIIALHGMSLSILRVTSTLRDAMMRDHIRTDVYEAESVSLNNQKMKEHYEKQKINIVMGSNTVRSLTGFAGVEASAMGASVAAGAATEAGAVSAATAAAGTARVSTTVSRAGTAAARTVRFARFAGGALSAAVLVMEANAIQSTVKSISQGSPCDKANRLRNCLKEIQDFPSTTDLDQECQSYLEVLASRPEPPIEVVAESDEEDGEEIVEAPCQQVDGGTLCAPGAVIVEVENASAQPTASAVPVGRRVGSLFRNMQNRREDRRVAREEVVAVAVEDEQLGESNFSLVL
mmetsp:Transcript_12086/g.24930  ORF Transcript_12086/g.24930 Transcript_12086/m.24930 type:complete len:851 (+) Transcript_12086:136-2688(+)